MEIERHENSHAAIAPTGDVMLLDRTPVLTDCRVLRAENHSFVAVENDGVTFSAYLARSALGQ
jgi:hypothetical protein